MIDLKAGLTITEVTEVINNSLDICNPSTNDQVESLNNISSAEVSAACNAALVDYNVPTSTELATTEANIRGGDDTLKTVFDEAAITEIHIHSIEQWCGKSVDQSGNNWANDTLVPFQAISGNGVYGADADDEAKIIGSDDTPYVLGSTYFDLHRMTIVELTSDSVYKVRTIWGTGTMEEAIAANQTTLMYLIASADKATKFGGSPFELQMPRLASGTKLWVQIRNATDNATMDFFVGLHEYDE